MLLHLAQPTNPGPPHLHTRSVPAEQLPHALRWEALLLEKAAAAGSTPVLVYNTKLSGSGAAASAEAVAAALPRLQAVLNPSGTVPSCQLELSHEASSDRVAGFLQAAAAAAAQHEAPHSLPQQYLSGECDGLGRSCCCCWGQQQPDQYPAGSDICTPWGTAAACGPQPAPLVPLPTPAPAEDAMVFLNIPMDAETPSLRLLRPQVRQHSPLAWCVLAVMATLRWPPAPADLATHCVLPAARSTPPSLEPCRRWCRRRRSATGPPPWPTA